MNIWLNAVITEKGLALLSKLAEGSTLHITKAQSGSGSVAAGMLVKQTAVTTPQQNLTFRPESYPESGKCAITCVLSNDELTTEYTATQIGIFADDPDEGEILFFIVQSETGTGTVVPSKTEMPGFNAEWNFYFQIGQADGVEVYVDPANAVSAEQMEIYVSGVEQQVNAEIDALKKSVSDGKSGIAAAITEKGVETAADASFSQMQTNIRKIETKLPNGKSWTQVPQEYVEYAGDIVRYFNGTWVVSGLSGTIYSDDGMNWDTSTDEIFGDIQNAGGIWVAASVCRDGIYYSINGRTWTQSNINSGDFVCVHNNNGIWVACSDDTKGICYSTDGKTWTQSNIKSGYYEFANNANGIWVAGNGSAKGLYYSTDGMAWTQSNITSGAFSCADNANGIWVAGSKSGGGLYYSTDGMTWTQSNTTSGSFNCIYNANGIWVAGSGNGGGLYYSTDGMTWTQSNITSGYFGCVHNANGIWVAGSTQSKGLYYSADGKTWNRSDRQSGNFRSVHNANGIWIAAGEQNNCLYYSLS